MHKLWGSIALGCVFVLMSSTGCREAPALAQHENTYVGRQVCGSCHLGELRAYNGSHHDRAMEGPPAALGDFSGARLQAAGEEWTFFRRDDTPWVMTRGRGGAPRELPVRHTFGFAPLQQLLVETERGRLQALPVAWDSRPQNDGGGRWFHLYPDEALNEGDSLHWTGTLQNWNSMCAECHSTGVVKGYDSATDRFATTFTEVDVSCEACHGPGAAHVAWAKGGARGGSRGLVVALTSRATPWQIDPATGSARPQPGTSFELDTCGQCHSRRTPLADQHEPGRPLADGYRLALLEPGLFHADGQVEGEVFELGSFLQSRMHAAGVSCSDCHEPHSATLKAEGNALCGRCHTPAKFDTTQHHHHAQASAAAACVSCHMPEQTFLGVDGRRDHGFRVPRPDLSAKLGTPNACGQCHADETAGWASEALTRWGVKPTGSHWGEALVAGRRHTADAPPLLAEVALDDTVPAIVRATALELLAGAPGEDAHRAARFAVNDPDPLVRSAAATALAGVEASSRRALAAPLLYDPIRLVRLAAAKVLLPDADQLAPDLRLGWEAAFEELMASERAHAERPEALLNLGAYEAARGELDAARAAFERALALDPNFDPARLNLAILAGADSTPR